MQKLKDKGNSQRYHFKKRLKERYGIAINNEVYQGFVKAIQTGERQTVEINGHILNVVASYRARQSNRVTVYALMFGGIAEAIPVCYDNARKELITTHEALFESHKNLDTDIAMM